jgi:hypothetical protein
MTTTIRLTRQIYTLEALQQTVAAFAGHCDASFSAEEESHVLQITTTNQQVKDEFLNYVLGLSAQEKLR